MWWWYQLFKVLFLMRWTPQCDKKQWTRLWTTKGGYCFFARILGAAFWSHTQYKIHWYLFLEIGSITRWPCNQFPKDRTIYFLWNISLIQFPVKMDKYYLNIFLQNLADFYKNDFKTTSGLSRIISDPGKFLRNLESFALSYYWFSGKTGIC